MAGTLSWADGEGGSKSFDLSLTSDTVNEGAETIALSLSNFVGGCPARGSPSSSWTRATR